MLNLLQLFNLVRQIYTLLEFHHHTSSNLNFSLKHTARAGAHKDIASANIT